MKSIFSGNTKPLGYLGLCWIKGSMRMFVPFAVWTRTVACPSHVTRVPFKEIIVTPIGDILLRVQVIGCAEAQLDCHHRVMITSEMLSLARNWRNPDH